MILTVTANPAIDKLYLVKNVGLNKVQKVLECVNTAGGKGINVSKPARLLGAPVTATGFLGGYTARFIRSTLKKLDIKDAFVKTKVLTRTCINIIDAETGDSTEFLEPGETLTQSDIAAFFKIFEALLPEADIVTVSGSTMKGTPLSFYSEIITIARKSGKMVLLDAKGELLKEALKAKPYLIKPNLDEMSQLFGTEITAYNALDYGKRLASEAINVAVSLGKDGSFLICGEGVFRACAPRVSTVNTVGCGDAMLAGFAVGLSKNKPLPECLKIATAVSAAKAMHKETGVFDPHDYERLLKEVKIERIGK